MHTVITRMIRLLSFAAVFCSFTVAAQERTFVWPVKLEKDYTKTYPVGSETVSLHNRYGKLTIQTWDKNEVTVEAHISVSAQHNEYATKALDRISIADEKKSDVISFETRLGDWNDNGNNGGYEMRIDYTVHLPAKAKLYAENNFGPIDIGDYAGECQLVDKYGTLTAGKLSNCKYITVEFGKAIVESISNTDVLFKYSRVDINKLSGNIKGQFEFCNSVDMVIDEAVQSLDLKSNYTSVYMALPKDFSAVYDIATNNAKLSSKYLVVNEEKGAISNSNYYTSNHRYSGSFGKGGGTKISIRSNFGNIRFM